MKVRFSGGELALIDARAKAEGLVTAAYIGIAALAAADPQAAAGHARRAELNALVDATEQLRRAGHVLNQVVMTMHTLKQVRPSVQYITDRVWALAEALEEAAVAVAGPLRVKRRRRR